MAKATTTFTHLINALSEFWALQGCSILQPYTTEVGAGTLHPATLIRCLSDQAYRCSYVQSSIRPADGRYGDNPNRLYMHHQYQVILKPSPVEIQDLYWKSLEYIGFDVKKRSIEFHADDWANPSVGAWGMGWEVWLDGMEISQFTYMQQIGGIDVSTVPGELTYGLERIAMYLQDKDNCFDLKYDENCTYADVFKEREYEFTKFALENINLELYTHLFELYEAECLRMEKLKLPLVAYDFCLKASHTLNLLDASGLIGYQERAKYMMRVSSMTKAVCTLYKNMYTLKG